MGSARALCGRPCSGIRDREGLQQICTLLLCTYDGLRSSGLIPSLRQAKNSAIAESAARGPSLQPKSSTIATCDPAPEVAIDGLPGARPSLFSGLDWANQAKMLEVPAAGDFVGIVAVVTQAPSEVDAGKQASAC